MKQLLLLSFAILITFSSCIPTRIAPRFKNKDHRIMVAKKFKRKLPRETSFIFKDPKDADEFYNYFNTKYQLNHIDVGFNTPIVIDDETFYLSYREAEKEDKQFNVLGVVADKALETKGFSPMFDSYVRRKGHWYLILTVYDENVENCLLDKHPKQGEIITYLKALKSEYLNTQNYKETLFTKKS